MPSFIITSINDENCGIPYKYNIKFVDELSSILSVNCLQFCRWTVFKMCVGELSCRWTVSIPGLQTADAYSTCGRKRELYAMVLKSLFLVTTFLSTKPSVLLAVLVILLMWVFQLRSLLMVTPRYFAVSTDSSSWLCMKYLGLTRLLSG